MSEYVTFSANQDELTEGRAYKIIKKYVDDDGDNVTVIDNLGDEQEWVIDDMCCFSCREPLTKASEIKTTAKKVRENFNSLCKDIELLSLSGCEVEIEISENGGSCSYLSITKINTQTKESL